jgi:hypothetical protein
MGTVRTDFVINDLASGPLKKIASNTTAVDSALKRTASSSPISGVAKQAETATGGFSKLRTGVNNVGGAMATTRTKSSGLLGSIKGIIGTVGGLYAVQKAFTLISDSISAAMNRTQQETKLATIMQERMGTNNIKGVTSTMTAESQTGVLGTTTQMQGAQQMATFLNEEKSLKTLIPAMDNLAVQQKGVNATGEDMRNIGNMVGKVMQGQTGALKRVGISFTAAQEKAIKYGSEQERAAALASVINNNVGDMNKAIAKTPQGQMAQLKNKMAGVKLEIGQGIMPALTNMNKALGKKDNLTSIKMMASVFGALVSGVLKGLTSVATGVSTVFGWIGKLGGSKSSFTNLSNAISTVTKALAIGVGIWGAWKTAVAINNALMTISAARAALATGSTVAQAAATKTATGAQVGLNAAMLASPLTWVIAAIAAVVVVLIVLQKKFGIFTKLWSHIKKTGSSLKKGFGAALDSTKDKISKFASHMDKKFKAAGKATKTFMKSCKNSTYGVKGVLGGLNNFVSGVFTGNWGKAWKGVVQIFKTIFNSIKAVAKAPLNGVIWLVNKAISGINSLHVSIPSWVPKIGGKSIGFNIPKIPQLAKGTRNFTGNMALVGENGPEYVQMPKGSSVYSNGESRRMGTSRSVVVNKLADKIVVREEADIDKIAVRIAKKLEDIEADVVMA